MPQTEAKNRELYSRVQRMLVGAVIADGSSMVEVMKHVTEEDFEEPSLALIFSAMAELSRTSEKISPVSVAQILETRGQLTEIGGVSTLYDLFVDGENDYLLSASPEIYARIVKESSAKAKIARTFEEALPEFSDDSGVRAIDAASNVQSMLNERLLNLSDSNTMSVFNEGFDEYLDLIENRRKISEENSDREGLQGIPSLLPSLDKVTGGWMPGQMITVAAGTNVGKSIFGINCATAAMAAGATVMIFSLEMSRTQIEDRIMSSMTSIPINKLKRGELNSDDMRILRDQMEEMKKMNLVIDVEPDISIDGIRAKALKQAQTQEGLDFIIIDYLQLIKSQGRFSNRQEAVADISRNIKLMAKQLQIPIMALAQLNRAKDEDEESLPDLSKIRESHSIAQDSDIVLILHRRQTADSDTIPLTQVILDKNRDGMNKYIVRCNSILSCALFREVTKVSDVEERLDQSNEEADADDFDLDEFDDLDSDEDILEGF